MISIDACTLPGKTLGAALVALVLATTGCTWAQEANEARFDTAVLGPVMLGAYDADRGTSSASTREAYDAARANPRYAMEQFTYLSDGLTVGAYFYHPVDSSRPRPVVVFNRGGFVRTEFAGEMLVQAHRLAQAGFVVVAPFYRGSNGTAGHDEMGGAELADLMNIAPALRALAGVDENRIFLLGESRGGMMVYQALRDGFPARAAAVYGAFTDLETLIGPDGPQRDVAPRIWPDLEQRREEIIQRRSAIRWADRINAPILIMHGGRDGDIPLEHSQRMDAALTQAGKVHEFRVFPEARHTISTEGDARDAAIIAWFQRFD